MELLSDTDLYDRAVAGDRDAVELVVRRYHQQLTAYGRAWGWDDQIVQDGLQVMWMKFFQLVRSAEQGNGAGLHDPTKLLSWLATTLRNGLRDEHRRNRRQEVLEYPSRISVASTAVIDPDLLEDVEVGREAFETEEGILAPWPNMPRASRAALDRSADVLRRDCRCDEKAGRFDWAYPAAVHRNGEVNPGGGTMSRDDESQFVDELRESLGYTEDVSPDLLGMIMTGYDIVGIDAVIADLVYDSLASGGPRSSARRRAGEGVHSRGWRCHFRVRNQWGSAWFERPGDPDSYGHGLLGSAWQ